MAPSRVPSTALPCSSPAFSSSPSPSSPSSPLRLRLPKPPIPASLSGVAAVSASATLPNGTVLKWKRHLGFRPHPLLRRRVMLWRRSVMPSQFIAREGGGSTWKIASLMLITYANNKNW
ncbi:hypothetical protein S83_052163 [Arachis hypogaea]